MKALKVLSIIGIVWSGIAILYAFSEPVDEYWFYGILAMGVWLAQSIVAVVYISKNQE